jgi:peptide/nickel transport system substrate-binding protein
MGGLLAACGGDDDDEPAATSAATSSGGSGATATTAATEASTSSTGSGATATSAATSAATEAPTQASDIPTGGTLIYAITREPIRLDSSRDSFASSQMIHLSIHDCLVGRDVNNEYHPWLAESWEVASDGLSYTFELRQDVKFHDGTPFNAEAVQYLMERIHDPEAEVRLSPSAHGFYESTDVADEYTAVINLSAPWAPMLDALSYIYRVVSPTAAEEHGEDLGQNPVGTGPFMFKEWVANDHVTLVRNPDYNWGSTMFLHPGPAYLDEVIFRQIPEAGTRVAALENGEAHIIEVLPAQDAERINSDDNFNVVVGQVPGRPYCYTINVRKPPTDELAVRQAMWHAVSQELICQTVFGPLQPLGAFSPAHGMLVPGTWGYSEEAEIYEYDPEKAKQLLEEAGWTEGPNGIRQKNGQNLEILLATWEHGAAEVVQAQLLEVGIDYKIQVVTGLAANEAARREEVHMSPLPSARTDPDVLAVNHSRNNGAGNDFTFHSNAELDEMFDAGASAIDDNERLEIYKEIQMVMMQDAMQLTLYERDNVSAMSAKVGGQIIFERGFWPLLNDAYLEE